MMPVPQQDQRPGELEMLQQRVVEVKSAIDRMEAKRKVLQAQLEDKSLGMFKMGAQSQLMQVQVDLAEATAQFESLNQQIAQHGAQVHVDVPPTWYVGEPPTPPRTFLPWMSDDALTAASFVILFSVLVPLSLALTRRLWRRKPLPAVNPPGHEEVITRLGRLEQAIDTIAVEVERVAEGQRFVTKVMSERPLQGRAAVQAAEPVEPALGEAQPFLALGAGPIEPIRVAERQKAKQSITPH